MQRIYINLRLVGVRCCGR